MTLPRGRILREPAGAEPAGFHSAATATVLRVGRKLDRAVAEAHERSERVLEAAMQRASGILAGAERDAAAIRERAALEGRAEGLASASAWCVALRERESRADEGALDRVVELAKLLAERLLGRALSTEPATVSLLAGQALLEARGARRVELHANPADAPLLEGALAHFDPEGRVHAVVREPALARGDLRLNTEVGMIDARLGPELGRLAERLRTALTK